MDIKLATTYLLIAIITLFVILLLSSLVRRQTSEIKRVRGDDLDVWPFMSRVFMTNAEVRFFHQLKQAVPEFLIFAQVGLSRLIESTDEEDEKFWLNRINRMSLDYVLVNQDCQNVMVAIELDDWSHESQTRTSADLKKDKALMSAGIPIIRFYCEETITDAEIRQELLLALKQRHEWIVKSS